jgi:hypothetical protein
MTAANRIKISLYRKLFKELKKDYIAVPEVTILGNIADMLVTNGDIHIYEIKSKVDSLKRLPKQIQTFKKYANKVTVVADEKFIAKLLSEPYMQGVGIISVNDKYSLKTVRESESFDIHPPHYLAYFNIQELKETLRGFNGWYKFNFIEAEKKLLELLSYEEIRMLTLFRLKERYKMEFIKRKQLIKEKRIDEALQSRSVQSNTTSITPLSEIPYGILRGWN